MPSTDFPFGYNLFAKELPMPASVTTGMPNTTATYYGSPKKKPAKKVKKSKK
jgi:hypothetical protein